MSAEEIRCHSCSHALGRVALAVQLVALFKPSAVGRIPYTHRGELRRRCGSCGWVNVFHPDRPSEVIEVKADPTRSSKSPERAALARPVEHSAPGPLTAAHNPR